VNGSGKSTVLKTIAWVLDRGECGFDHEEWKHVLAGHEESRALALFQPAGSPTFGWACSKGQGSTTMGHLRDWGRTVLAKDDCHFASTLEAADSDSPRWLFWDGPKLPSGSDRVFNYSAYSPSKSLRFLVDPGLTNVLPTWKEKCLAFEGSVQNAAIQTWLLGVFSKRAIARERNEPSDQYTRSLARFDAALQFLYGQDVKFDVQLEPRLQPRLRMSGKSLNFSQLSDGVRSTISWAADFMMRQDLLDWDPSLEGKRPGLLMLDEVDAHLHPLWQRRLLPAMREERFLLAAVLHRSRFHVSRR